MCNNNELNQYCVNGHNKPHWTMDALRIYRHFESGGESRKFRAEYESSDSTSRLQRRVVGWRHSHGVRLRQDIFHRKLLHPFHVENDLHWTGQVAADERLRRSVFHFLLHGSLLYHYISISFHFTSFDLIRFDLIWFFQRIIWLFLLQINWVSTPKILNTYQFCKMDAGECWSVLVNVGVYVSNGINKKFTFLPLELSLNWLDVIDFDFPLNESFGITLQ